MDPALAQLLAQGDAADEVEIILKLREEDSVPPAVRIVARFGDVVTCRIPRGQVRGVWESDAVLSAKAPRLIAEEPAHDGAPSGETVEAPSVSGIGSPEIRHVPSARATGRNVVVATVDWGLDFAHPNFRRPDGSTRLLALWDQGSRSTVKPSPEPYGYGVVHTREEIDAALRSGRPYEALGYHPADADAAGDGAHGTHVADISAGSGLARGAVPGVAPEADLLFVHLAAGETGGLATLGDTARILESMDFIARTCGSRPWVANLSVGRCGGPHTGLTLVENGLDNLLREAPGRAIVQSAGNYYDARVHAAGRLRPGEDRTLHWIVSQADITPNECEIFYSGRDTFAVAIRPPGGPDALVVNLDETSPIVVDGRTVGHAYHRAFDPGRGEHHVDIFLDAAAPGGTWEIGLLGRDILDGRFDAWVERDAACPSCQSRFDARDAVAMTTTGTIANGFRTIAVGAYDARLPGWPLARFSSSGLTRDGREKPNLIAPGVEIEAARSAPRGAATSEGLLTRKSGTSMAAPFVTGTIACMFEAAGRPLWVHETRRLLMGNARGINAPPETAARIGSGYLDTARAIAAVREMMGSPRTPARRAATTGGTMRTETYQGSGTTASAEMSTGRTSAHGEAFRAPLRDDGGDAADACGIASESGIAPRSGIAESASLFDALSGYRPMPRSHRLNSMFEVVGAPRQPLRDAIRPGDIVVRRALGEGTLAHTGTVASGEVVPRDVAYRSGWIAERSAPGLYGVLMEEESYGSARPSVARRLLDERGVVPYDQIILRPRRATEIGLGEVARGGILNVPADRHGNGAPVTQVRPEFAGAYQRMYDQVHALGGIVTSAGGLRALERAEPGQAWQPRPGRSSTSLHYTGRAIDLSTESGMQRADNPYAVTLERELPDGRPLWHVYCVSTDPHPDSPLYDPALIQQGVLECLIWVRNQPPRRIRREGRFFSLTEVMRRNGLSRIPARRDWRSEYMAVEWWHFQFEDGLVNGVTTFGQEVGRVWTPDELATSTLTPFLHYVWRNGAFVAPAAGAAAAPANTATERVRWAQVVLNAAGGERLDADGDLGPRTRDALRRFQEREQLTATGALDERTEIALVQRGLEAIALQSMFGAIGTVDARLIDEVRRFQAANGLTVDGLVGPAVRAAMTAALAARVPQEQEVASILR